MMLNDKSNGGILISFKAWNEPVGTDIVAFGWREPIVKNLVVKGAILRFVGLVAIVQLGGLG